MDPEISEMKDKYECNAPGAWLLVRLYKEEPGVKQGFSVILNLISLDNIIVAPERSAHPRS